MPADAVDPRATFSSADITCWARFRSRLLVYVTLLVVPGVVFSTACACAAVRFADPSLTVPPICWAITAAVTSG
jgi:hypothetical protein